MYAQLRTSLVNSSKFLCPNLMYTRAQIAQITNAENLRVSHDEKNSEFFVKLGDDKAFIQYKRNGNLIRLEETQVPDVFSRKGVGRVLAKAAFDYCVQHNFKIELICTYLQHYYKVYGQDYKDHVQE